MSGLWDLSTSSSPSINAASALPPSTSITAPTFVTKRTSHGRGKSSGCTPKLGFLDVIPAFLVDRYRKKRGKALQLLSRVWVLC